MSFNKESLRQLDEARVNDSSSTIKNLLDVSVQVRATYVADDIKNGNIKLAIDRINMFILPDDTDNPGICIDELVFNRSPSGMLYTKCHVYIIAMFLNKKVDSNEYMAASNCILKLLEDNSNITYSTYEKHKQIVEYYEINTSELDTLSYLF